MTDCFCDYESPDVYRPRRITAARKQHKCDECYRQIGIGEPYESCFGVWEGRSDTYRTCRHCLALRDFVTQNVKCFCWAHGSMIDDAISTADTYYEQGNGLLFGALRRKVLIERAKK